MKSEGDFWIPGGSRRKEDSQKFIANENGTISPLKAVDLVLGMETIWNINYT